MDAARKIGMIQGHRKDLRDAQRKVVSRQGRSKPQVTGKLPQGAISKQGRLAHSWDIHLCLSIARATGPRLREVGS